VCSERDKPAGIPARARGELLADAVGLTLLFAAVRREHDGVGHPADAADEVAEGRADDAGHCRGEAGDHRKRRRPGDPSRGVSGGDVPDLVAKYGGELVLRVEQREQAARHVHGAAGERECVRLGRVDDREGVWHVATWRQPGQPLADRSDVRGERRILDQPHRLGNALRLGLAEIALRRLRNDHDLGPPTHRVDRASREQDGRNADGERGVDRSHDRGAS